MSDLKVRIESWIRLNVVPRGWKVVWPNQVANGLDVSLEVASTSMLEMARLGKLKAFTEFYDAEGNTIWCAESPDGMESAILKAVDVEVPIETSALFFELQDGWITPS